MWTRLGQSLGQITDIDDNEITEKLRRTFLKVLSFLTA